TSADDRSPLGGPRCSAGDRSSALVRMRLLQDVLTGLSPAPTPTASPAARHADGGVRRRPASLHAAEGNDPYSILKGLNSYDYIVARRDNVATQQINKTQSSDGIIGSHRAKGTYLIPRNQPRAQAGGGAVCPPRSSINVPTRAAIPAGASTSNR